MLILAQRLSQKKKKKKKKKKKNAAKPESLEKGIGCMNCKEFYYMVLMARQGMNLKLITGMLMLLLYFHLY